VVGGKADFSVDDRYLLYVAQSVNPSTRTSADTVFLADLSTNQSEPIYHARVDGQLAFPGFISPDRIVVLDPAASQLILLERTRVIQH
jgi:hypothetical protein